MGAAGEEGEGRTDGSRRVVKGATNRQLLDDDVGAAAIAWRGAEVRRQLATRRSRRE